MRNARSAVRQSITTGFVGMIFGYLAFRLGIREGHLAAERRLPLGCSAQEGERKIGVGVVAPPIFDSHGLAFVVTIPSSRGKSDFS